MAGRTFEPEELRARLKQYDRTPFIEVLALFLENIPSETAIRVFAEKYPDRYVNAISNLGAIAGFTTKTEQTNNINVHVTGMSDSQLEDELKKRMSRLDVTDRGPLIDGEVRAEEVKAPVLARPKGPGTPA